MDHGAEGPPGAARLKSRMASKAGRQATVIRCRSVNRPPRGAPGPVAGRTGALAEVACREVRGELGWYHDGVPSRPWTMGDFVFEEEEGVEGVAMTELIFDKWQHLYATRTEGMKSSEVRELFRYASRPDVISLAGGMPYTKNFPFDKVIEATKSVMRHQGAAALQYGVSEGHDGLRTHIRQLMELDRVKIDEEDIIVTAGAQQALDLVGKVFIDKGSKVLVEAPSYVGALNAFYAFEPEIIHIPMDDSGLRVDILANTLEELERKGEKPKFLYTVLNFHNPAGVTLSADRRLQLIDIARKHDLVIVEDNAYGRLRFEGEQLPVLRALDPNIIHLGSFSKILAPGLRLGWVIAPQPILDRLNYAKQAADLCTSNFSQFVVEEYINKNLVAKHIEKIIATYTARRDVMLQALEEFFPDEATWTRPQGGMFLWVTLPDFIDTREMLAEAVQHKVAYISGRGFYADGRGGCCMRLNFSFPEEDAIYEGVKRLSKVIKDQMVLYTSVQSKLKL